MKVSYVLFALLFAAGNIFAKPVLPIRHWQTHNNVQVYFVQAKQLPMLDVRAVFDAGSRYDGQQYGLAALTSSMLNEGVNTLNADQIAEKFDNIGAQFSANTSRDMSILSLRCLTKKPILNSAVSLFNKIITQPTFPQDALGRLKNQALAVIAQQQQSPATVANKTFFENLYKDHPYAHSIVGKKETVNKITQQDAQQFYKKYYSAKNMSLILVGDVSLKKAHDIAAKIVNKLPGGNKASGQALANPVEKKLVQKINFPGTQSYIRVGCLGINYQDPNYYPLLVGNYILGKGMLISRLFLKLRQQHGLTYSAKSHFLLLQERGPFMISLQTKNESATKALKMTKQVLREFVHFGLTPQELASAKKYLLGSFALKFDSNAKIANALIPLAFYNLPENYFDTYKQKIDAVTNSQIKSAFQKIMGKQKLVTVLVGGA
jgi:zinc protease